MIHQQQTHRLRPEGWGYGRRGWWGRLNNYIFNISIDSKDGVGNFVRLLFSDTNLAIDSLKKISYNNVFWTNQTDV